jgi:hypothetical protein
MTFENQLGSVMSRLRTCEAQVQAIEDDLTIEKANLKELANELKMIREQLRTPT